MRSFFVQGAGNFFHGMTKTTSDLAFMHYARCAGKNNMKGSGDEQHE
jgi:hypothetical protein